MSIQGNIISSGSIGLFPTLHVTAPANSTLDLYFNSIIINSYTLTGEEITHDFEVYNHGTYTITSTRGTESRSLNILIDRNCIYNVNIVYALMIYDGTTEFYPLEYHYFQKAAGGSKEGQYGTHSKTKNSDNLYINFTASNYYNVNGAFVTSAIDITNYSKLYIDVSGSVSCSGTIWTGAAIIENNWSGGTENMKTSAKSCGAPSVRGSASFSRDIYSANIASLTGNYYLGVFAMEWGYYGYKRCNIYKMWLE